MPQHMNEKSGCKKDELTGSPSGPLLDPRGRQLRGQLKLAARVTMDHLRTGPVLFFDNTKLSYGNYAAVFSRIKDVFRKNGIDSYIDHCETVRGKSTGELRDLGERLAEKEPVAAIVALGDMGVAPATTILTIALEELGIPSVFITAPPGTALAKATAFYRAGRLCLCNIDLHQYSTAEDIRDQVDELIPAIMEALTLHPQRIDERASLEFALDTEAPAEDGFLSFAPGKLADGMDIADAQAVTDFFNKMRIGDGLPVIPPTEERYRRMMAYCQYRPDEVVAVEIGPSGQDIRARDIAVNAVLAGCQPQHMPILLTVFRAMAEPAYNLLQSVSTAHPGGDMVLVSGPLATELGIAGGPGCFGPGFPANACIGRAVKLVQINVCRAVPGISDLAGLSSPAEFSFCFAEEPGLSPWPLIHEERGDGKTTVVYVLKAESPHDIVDLLSQSADDLMVTLVDSCTTLGSNNAFIPGPLVLVLTPDHASILAHDGWDKRKIREYLHNHVHHSATRVENRGIVPVRPASFAGIDPIPVTRSAEDIEIVVAGARGGHSAVILPWALHSEAVVRPVVLPDGRVPGSIEEFRNP